MTDSSPFWGALIAFGAWTVTLVLTLAIDSYLMGREFEKPL